MPVPPQIAWMLGAATGCIVSTVGMNLVFRNPQTGVVRECSLEEITSLEKLDASEIDITKLGKEVPTDDLELYMRYLHIPQELRIRSRGTERHSASD